MQTSSQEKEKIKEIYNACENYAEKDHRSRKKTLPFAQKDTSLSFSSLSYFSSNNSSQQYTSGSYVEKVAKYKNVEKQTSK